MKAAELEAMAEQDLERLRAVRGQQLNGTGTGFPLPAPLPDGLPKVPDFSPELLPDALRPWCMDITERLQCAPDYPAVGAMVTLGALVGRKLTIRPKEHDDWQIVPNLWGCIVGRPSVLKSPALEQVTKPLRQLAAEAKKAHADELIEYQADLELARLSRKQAEKDAAALNKKGNRHDARGLLRDLIKSEQLEMPREPRFFTNDCTVEKLGEILADNPRGVMIFRDELTGFLTGLDKSGQESARSFYLESWNGSGSFTYDRIGRGTVHIDACCTSIIGGTQPGPLSAYMRAAMKGGIGDDGLAQRFQLLVWPDLGGWKHVDRWPDLSAREVALGVYQRMENIDPLALGAVLEESDSLPYLHFEKQAQELFNAWYSELNQRSRSGEFPACLEAHLSKYSKTVPALALLIHLADGGSGSVNLDSTIRAIKWANYLESHARRLYAPSVIGDEIAARELAAKLLRKVLPDRFTARDVYRKGWSGLSTVKDAEAALDFLCELGGVIKCELDTGGRPKVEYQTNPRIAEVWA